MGKVLKWIGIILGVVIGLLLIAVAAVYGISTYRFNRTFDVQVEAVEIPTDQLEAFRNYLQSKGIKVFAIAHNSIEAVFAGDYMTVVNTGRELDIEGWAWKNYEKIKIDKSGRSA